MERLLFAQRVNSNEKGSFMKKKAAVLLTAAVLSGCAGPSTKVLPQRQSGTMQEVPDEVPVVEEVNSISRNLWEFFRLLPGHPEAAARTMPPGTSRNC